MSEVRETSIKCYEEIQEEGIYDSRMEEVLDAIRRFPLMTGREYASIILKRDDMNEVRPRITDLKNAGCIIEVGKRKCTCSDRTSFVWATLEGIEKQILLKLGFIEQQKNLYILKDEGNTLFQDFRKGKRRSYAFNECNQLIAHRTFEIHNKFKEELKNILTQKLS